MAFDGAWDGSSRPEVDVHEGPLQGGALTLNACLLAASELLKIDRVVLMCAKALPWCCHRSLISDALTVRGHAVCEISSAPRLPPRKLP